MTITIAIANNKGGVGKTAFTVQTAAALARAGKRVLVVDFDPQANTSRRLGVEWNQDDQSLTINEAVKAAKRGAAEGIETACGWEEADGSPTAEAKLIDVIRAKFDLNNRESEAGETGAVRRLERALEGWTSGYDFILIDTRPSLGHTVQMAFTAADYVLIPTEPGYDGAEAAIRVSDFIDRHAEDLFNPGLSVGGVVITRYRNTAERNFQFAELKARFGDLVWNLAGTRNVRGAVVTVPECIPEWTRFDEADAAAVSLTAWSDRRAKETIAIYDTVADRIMTKLTKRSRA